MRNHNTMPWVRWMSPQRSIQKITMRKIFGYIDPVEQGIWASLESSSLLSQQSNIKCLQIPKSHPSFLFWSTHLLPTQPCQFIMVFLLPPPKTSHYTSKLITQSIKELKTAHSVWWDSLGHWLYQNFLASIWEELLLPAR